MQYYRCKCGIHTSWGSMGPSRCTKCHKCGSDLAQSPLSHREPSPHEFQAEEVETDNGPQPLSRCIYCHHTRAEIERDERLANPILGLDFGNVIHYTKTRQPMHGIMEALTTLKERFGDRMYVVSRVDNKAGEDYVLAFLRTNGFFDTLLKSDNVYFTRLRSEKGPICDRLGITHFVDDRTECLHYMTKVIHRFALQPTEQQIKDFPPKGMRVVYTWWEITDFITKY